LASASAASAAATAIVFITTDSGEGYITVASNAGDRNNLDSWHSGNDLVDALAAVNKKTVVVIHSVGPIIRESILALDNVKAVVRAGLRGQESGKGFVDVLYSSTAPSVTPFTIAKAVGHYGTAVTSGDDGFVEGLYIDDRHFDKNNIRRDSSLALGCVGPSPNPSLS
jgi:beta-glucosidase